MISKADVLRSALRLLPKSMQTRLLRRPEIQAMAELHVGRWQSCAFGYGAVREALATTVMGGEVSIAANGAEQTDQLVLRRTESGVTLKSGESDSKGAVDEISVLDPDRSVRLAAIEGIASRALPWWPTSARWRSIASERALLDSEYMEFIRDVADVAGTRLAAIGVAIKKATISVDDFVPSGRAYYESLVGPVPGDMPAARYIQEVVYPRLHQLLARNTQWGWMNLRWLFVGPSVDLARVLDTVEDAALLEAMRSPSASRSPFPTVALLSAALHRADRSAEFLAIANAASETLFAGESAFDQDNKAGVLTSALMEVTLDRLSVDEETWSAPPYWRRWAAAAHAHALMDAADLRGIEVDSFAQWCASTRSPAAILAGYLDLRVEPLWHSSFEYLTHMRQVAASHAIQLCRAAQERGLSVSIPPTVSAAAESVELRDFVSFLGALPDLLAASFEGAPSRGEEMTREHFSDIPAEGPPRQRWHVVLGLARTGRFNAGLRAAIGDWFAAQCSADGVEFATKLNTAWLVASISAAQSDEDLAERCALFILESADQVNDEVMVAASWAVLMIAAASRRDAEAWKNWVSAKMLGMARQLPKGRACRELMGRIDAMRRFLPLDDQRLQTARALAASAAG